MEVRLVQFWLRLAADNYSALRTVTVDGSYGAATVSAVEAFQTLFGLTPDGVVGRSTWNKLKEVGLAVANKIVAANVAPGQFTTTTRAGSSGTAVRAVQYYLRRLAAYYSDVPRVAVDGKFGAATTRAVKAWQSRAGLTVDGVVGRCVPKPVRCRAGFGSQLPRCAHGQPARARRHAAPRRHRRGGAAAESAAALFESVDTGNQLYGQ
jgi:peptidoglycan hydrolase-like protein with peptidoglycan-binding domain